MSYNLARYGKWGLVTGASSGIGLEFARAIAAEGLNLILVARRRERLESLAAELRERNGIEAQVIVMDLTCLKELEGLNEQVGSKELGLLVLNAGYGYYGRFVDQTEDDLGKMITLNCTSTALLARKLLPGMIQRKKGAVIIVSSVLGFFPGPWISAYSATKAFDLMLGESLAPKLKEAGIDLVNLCPASTRTEFHDVAGKYRPGWRKSLSPIQAEPDRIVRLALKSLGRKLTVFPAEGLAASLVTRILPRGWRSSFIGWITKWRISQG